MDSLKQADAAVKLAHEKFSALAVENAGLKAAKEIIRHLNVNREEANFCGIDDCHIDDAVEAMVTPATDSFLADVRNEAGARAVELFSQTLGSPYTVRDEKCYEDGFTRAIEVVRNIQAPRFAAQLRKGGRE
ncbi:hypothetical protein DL151_20355 [Salmonella enterica subsp. salamae]|nr:hypothetical protein [Salmonella enterica subsp. salamae]EDR0193587.1 hypothetical protein [Salmonella enterica subsp. houtenae]MJG41001.1 hypothetical protein [Salmonella enterica subsp. salamae]